MDAGKGGAMRSKVKLLLDFAKGNNTAKKRMKIYSVIDGEKKLMEEHTTDAPVCINIEVHATDEAQLQMQVKSVSLSKSKED